MIFSVLSRINNNTSLSSKYKEARNTRRMIKFLRKVSMKIKLEKLDIYEKIMVKLLSDSR